MATSSLTDAINQNTVGNSQGFPMGVPSSYSWYNGANGADGSEPPSNFTSVTGWGQVYPLAGAPTDANASASVQVANFKTFVHLKNGGWVEVQDQSTNQIAGAHFVADFSGNAAVAWNETKLSDGSVSVDAPQSGYNDHFWPDARGTYAAGTIDGVFVEAQMKASDPTANLVANLGADWWLNASAPYVDGFANNPGVGMSNWVKLSTDYQTLYFTSLSPAALQADPPPGLTSAPVTDPPAVTTPITDPPVTAPPVTSSPVTTPPATTSPTTTSEATRPVLSVADNTLSVQPGGKIDLGISVSTTDKNDVVSVNIRGLASYETITDNLDGRTFTGKNISLTAAQVASGLVLQSNYQGRGEPTATLSVTATGKDPISGAVATSATKTITVTDPPAAASGSSGAGGGFDHHRSFALLSQSLASGFHGCADVGQIATAVSQATGWLNDALLTRPHR